ncbi:MAG: stage IV sporulation protein A [Eubacterium sp.]
MDNFNLYKDIESRTNGEIYLGIVGPVRTGKSTFIKRFMDLMVLPNMTDINAMERTRDELPQSANGKTIMTTEPKFIPKEAAKLKFEDGSSASVKLIDCVGYMVNGAEGQSEDGKERMVKTPWYDYDIPFSKAAEIGTHKVINDHSTIGLVVTTDGSFGDIERKEFVEAENLTITELKNIGKPFVVVVNSSSPYSQTAVKTAEEISTKHNVTAIPLNCQQLKKNDVMNIMEAVLNEFPISKINVFAPKWMDVISISHPIKKSILEEISSLIKDSELIRDIGSNIETSNEYIESIEVSEKNLANGEISLKINIPEKYYYNILSSLSGANITDEYSLISLVSEMSKSKNEYSKFSSAIMDAKSKGYGIMTPGKEEITLKKPEIYKSGGKYGVKIKAEAPSLHFIKASILTEISPIIGDEDQANDLIKFINQNAANGDDGIWSTNIFGKTIEEIVADGIKAKVSNMSEETQARMQDTLQKISNEKSRGVICIIL